MERGVLVGTKTYGKGLVQTVFVLPDGGALKLTTSKYYG
jgi:carboxyl-terminal processing protease